jgi:ribonuclease E
MTGNPPAIGAEAPVLAENGEPRQDRPPRGERGEGRRERGERGDHRPRGERGEGRNGGAARPDDTTDASPRSSAAQASDVSDAVVLPASGSETGEGTAPDNASRPEGEERRERRSRDRYGRDRRERNAERGSDRGDIRADSAAATGAAPTEEAGESREPAARSYFDRPTPAPAAPADPVEALVIAPAPVAESPQVADTDTTPASTASEAPVPPAGASRKAPAATLPEVVAFTLPMAELTQIAEQSGLQWVNSDADKIATVQAAIAAEPARVHVPRERAPIVVADEGPLVLVETKKDLRNLSLPF